MILEVESADIGTTRSTGRSRRNIKCNRKKDDVSLNDEGNYDWRLHHHRFWWSCFICHWSRYFERKGAIERGTVSGTCVNVGCVPSKTLLRAGGNQSSSKNNPFVGLQFRFKCWFTPLVKQKNDLATEMRMKNMWIYWWLWFFELIKGSKIRKWKYSWSKWQSNHSQKILIATGASFQLHLIRFYLISRLFNIHLLELKKVPNRLTVIGLWYIGMELDNYLLTSGQKSLWFKEVKAY